MIGDVDEPVLSNVEATPMGAAAIAGRDEQPANHGSASLGSVCFISWLQDKTFCQATRLRA